MKTITLYLSGQKYDIEIEDKFYEFIKQDIEDLNNSKHQLKTLLNLMLKFSYNNYKNEQKINKLIKKLDL